MEGERNIPKQAFPSVSLTSWQGDSRISRVPVYSHQLYMILPVVIIRQRKKRGLIRFRMVCMEVVL